MKCKYCRRIATRSSTYGVFCEEHWREVGMDGTSVEEEAAKIQRNVKGNYD